MNEQEFTEAAVKGLKNAPKADSGYLHGIDIRKSDHLIFNCPMEGLHFEVLGGMNIKQLDRMRVTLKVSRHPQLSPVHVFRHTLDLYNDNQVNYYIRSAAEKLETGTTDITRLLYTLIEGLEKYRMEKAEAQEVTEIQEQITLSPKQKKEALALLKDKNLLSRVTELLKSSGLVQEELNGLLLFLIFQTRFFDYPLHAIIHGSSGSGKTNLLKTVISCIPPEQCHITTALTENVLFYPPYKEFWRHKILMLEDLDGSLTALLPLREFMSNQYISKLTPELNLKTGEHRQKILEAKGPVCIVGATTKDKIYEDNSNRSYLIHVDESKQHQREVMEYQNALAAGLIRRKAQTLIAELLHNAQRLLEPIEVRNPFQPELMLPDCVFKPLRTNTHYISLIQAVTFFHQFQCEIHTDQDGIRYIETTLDHIAWANRLCRESLLRKSDQLTGAQRTFFERLKVYLNEQGINKQENKGFFAKDVREFFRLHTQTLKRSLEALESLGLITRIGNNRKLSFEYMVNVWDDYTHLQQGIDTLDHRLQELRDKYPGA